MNTLPPLPPGFQLEGQPGPTPNAPSAPQGGLPPLPSGFQLEGPQQASGGDLMARMSQMSQFPGATVDPQSRYHIALRKVREQFPGITDAQWRDYSAKFLAPYDPKDLAQQSQTFGFGDEIGAGMGAAASQVGNWLHGDSPGYGDAYGANYELEQARLALGREQQGALGTAMEFLGGASTMGPAGAVSGAIPAATTAVQGGSRLVQAAKAAVPLMGEGALYGFGSTDGSLQDRALGAGIGAGTSAVAGALAQPIGSLIQGTARRVAAVPVNMANRRAVAQAVQSAPTAAGIGAGSKAAYRAAEATGAVIQPQAMQILAHDAQNLARMEGLVSPTGRLSTAYPKVAHALETLNEYTAGPVSIEQAQTLLRTLRTAQKSADPDEARLGSKMVNLFEDFMDSLPQSAFSKGNGTEAISQWARGRTEWAKSKRTSTIENIISDAQLHNGGFAAGLRQGFKDILKSSNAKKRRGFSLADLQAMRDFVDGGPVQELLKRIGSGAGLPGGFAGGMMGGPVGAVAVPLAGMGARRLSNGQARNAAQALRAQVALPGGIPQRAMPVSLPLPPGVARLGGVGANVNAANDPNSVRAQLLRRTAGGI